MAINSFPAANTFDVPVTPGDFTESDAATALNQMLSAATALPGGKQATTTTIVSGVLTVSQASNLVETEGGAATDTLQRILGTSGGPILILRQATSGHAVTISHGTSGQGHIKLAGDLDYVLDRLDKALIVEDMGSYWRELARIGDNPLAEHGRTEYDTAGTFTFTVPDGIYQLVATLIGGGAGGGGGAGTNSDGTFVAGTSGGNGAASSVGAIATGTSSGGTRAPATGQGGSGALGNIGTPGITGYAGHGGAAMRTISELAGTGGAGGNGAAPASGKVGGGGGQGGGPGEVLLRRVLSVSPGDSVTVVVGAGGTAGAGGVGSTGTGQAGEAGLAGWVLLEY